MSNPPGMNPVSGLGSRGTQIPATWYFGGELPLSLMVSSRKPSLSRDALTVTTSVIYGIRVPYFSPPAKLAARRRTHSLQFFVRTIFLAFTEVLQPLRTISLSRSWPFPDPSAPTTTFHPGTSHFFCFSLLDE
jgi:hypothetical protein